MNIPKRQFRNIAYLSDVTGTGFWRHIQQMLAANAMSQSLGIFNTYTQMPILDQGYYNGMTSVTVQRWLTDQQRQLFMGFLKPVCDAYSTWLIYEIDDAMHYDEIPLYNRGRAAFADNKIQQNIKEMLNSADFVIVTTNYLREYYVRKYNVDRNNIIAIPNLLPRWWFGDKFDLQKSLDDRNAVKAKPRIGIVSSLSHYNFQHARKTADGEVVKLDEKSNVWKTQDGKVVDEKLTQPINDDIDEIIDTVESTVDDFKWIFFGCCPDRLKPYLDKKKIEVYGTTSILNYPSMLKRLKLQAVVAPLVKSEFNFCKSPIKFLECCAIGVPLYATRCIPYTTVMDDSMLFDNADELKEKLIKLKFLSNGAYKNIIENNFKWLNSPHEDGDFKLVNYWLDDNIRIWCELFMLRKKTISINFDLFKKRYETELANKAKQTTLYNKNGIEIVK